VDTFSASSTGTVVPTFMSSSVELHEDTMTASNAVRDSIASNLLRNIMQRLIIVVFFVF
jgi:hypothetical protein